MGWVAAGFDAWSRLLIHGGPQVLLSRVSISNADEHPSAAAGEAFFLFIFIEGPRGKLRCRSFRV